MRYYYGEMETPIGLVRITEDEIGVWSVRFHGSSPTHPVSGPLQTDILKQVEEYFGKERKRFTIPIHREASPFMERVYRAAESIPYGQVMSYGEVALLASHPRAARAVGTAMKRCALPLLVPCHRVIGSGRTIGGYGGDTAIKQWLLHHEGVYDVRNPRAGV